jgi:hypothetical protein
MDFKENWPPALAGIDFVAINSGILACPLWR